MDLTGRQVSVINKPKRKMATFTGKVIHVLPLAQGVSKAGNPWKKQEFILEQGNNYATKVHITLFGDKVDKFPIEVGANYQIDADVESREFNGKWYTSVMAYNCQMLSPATAAPAPPITTQTVDNPEEDLPF